jgi:hypothetical protein
MKTNEILENIIANADGVPSDILEAFRVESIESGYDLATKEGADWYANRSILADFFRRRQAEPDRAASTVEFGWDFEEVGKCEFVKHVWVEGIEVDINEYAQDKGLAAARRYVKKLARKAGKIFKEVTDDGLAKDFARARLQAINAP